MEQPPSTISRLAVLFYRADTGQDLIEYALVAALVGLGAIAAVRGLGTIIGSRIASIASSFQSAT